MADFTLTRADVFPEGAQVGAYPMSNWATPALPSGEPRGEAADTQEVEDGELTFTGLAQGAEHWAVANVGGVYRYVKFVAGANLTRGSLESQVQIMNLGSDWSAGDDVTVYTANPAGRKAAIKDGTSGAPVTEAHPTIKVSRTSSVTTGITGDGSTELAAIYGSSSGTSGSKVQEVGVMGSAKSAGTSGEPDACGVYGVGRILAAGKGRAFGGFFLGRRDGSEQRATGVEIAVENVGGEDSYDINTGAETTKGIWLHGGTAQSAVGMQIGTISEAIPSFDVGIGINKFAIKSAAFQDNSTAARSIQIKGVHAKASISVAAGSGPVVLGNEEVNFAGSQLFEIYYGEEALDPGFVFGTGKGKSVSGILMRNSTGQAKIFASNAANAFLTGTAQGDTGINFTVGKIFHIGAQTKTSLLRVSETGVGFNGAAPVAKAEAIATPAETVASLKTAVDKLRVALTNVGITA